MSIEKQIGITIQQFRIYRKLSKKQLAELSNLSIAEINSLEAGDVELQFDQLFALTRAFEILPSDFTRALESIISRTQK